MPMYKKSLLILLILVLAAAGGTMYGLYDQNQAQTLDQGCGAANVMHYVQEGKDIIIATNREINEIAMYELTK